jgi:TRAP transporter TAXI family solute receptor
MEGAMTILPRNTRYFLALTLGLTAAATALGAPLPKTLSWTAYPLNSTGYIQAAAIGEAMAKVHGITVRVIPGGTDIARITPVRSGQVPFSGGGVGAYLSQEGVQDFASEEWGPQAVQLLMMSWADTNTGNVATGKDANIRTMADLRGKRVAWVHGSPALNQNMEAFLAFGGLTWKDVKKTEFPGFNQAMKAIVENTNDAAIASTDSGPSYEIESSPRGLHYPETPVEDKAGWARLRKVAPYFSPHVATAGAGMSPQKPHQGASYGYPILFAYPSVDPDWVYEQVKMIHTLFPHYKDSHPGSVGWAMDRQVFDWVAPYHPAAVKYFKEIGVWKPQHQKNNDALMKRQQVLASAWQATKAGVTAKGAEFQKAWMKNRAAALKKAGMDAVWDE